MRGKIITTALILALAVASIAQSYGLVKFLGIKVNIVLISIVTLSLFLENSRAYFLAVTIAATLSSLDSWFSEEFIAVFLVGSLAFFLKERFLHPGLYANALLIAISTLLLYLILSPSFILSSVFFIELLMNEVAGLILFSIFAKITGLSYRKTVRL